MSEAGAVSAATSGLLARPAGYSVVDRCLREQSTASPRTWLGQQLGLSPLTHRARSWYVGALGELEVAQRIAELGPEWTVVHSLPLGPRGADVDHLLVGPAGVLTVNTKAVRGHVWVGGTRILISGRRVDYIAAAEREARRVHLELTRATGSSVFVRSLLVFVRPDRITTRENPASVTVLTSDELIGWLGRQERIYPPSRVAELVAAADDVTTWRRGAFESTDTRRQMQRFDRLRAEVDEAAKRWRMTRLAAVLWGVALSIGALLLVAPAIIDTLG